MKPAWILLAYLLVSWPLHAEGLSERWTRSVVEQHEFYGLASYYNKAHFFTSKNGVLTELDSGEQVTLEPGEWFVVKGRLNVLAVRARGLVIAVAGQRFELKSEFPDIAQAEAITIAKAQLPTMFPQLDQLRYSHLGAVLAALTKVVEGCLRAIHAWGVDSWGLVIVVFSLMLKVLLLPLSLMTARLQRQVSRCKSLLAPQLAEIKASYDGEEAHKRILAAHKKLGVTPFYTLKPLATSLVQVPILIAVFNALGEMSQFAGASFLWIDDLAYPDSIATLPVALPMFGDTVSLLPFVMAGVTVFSTVMFKNRHALPSELRNHKRTLYLMAVAFFVLFYPFPASMVLFWTLANVLQAVQQQLMQA